MGVEGDGKQKRGDTILLDCTSKRAVFYFNCTSRSAIFNDFFTSRSAILKILILGQ